MQSSCSYIDYTTVQSREVGFFHSEISLFNLFEEVKFLVLLLTLCFLIGVHIKKDGMSVYCGMSILVNKLVICFFYSVVTDQQSYVYIGKIVYLFGKIPR